MFRFTLRDMFWFVLLVAVLITWWREGMNSWAEKRTLETEKAQLQAQVGTIFEDRRNNEPRYVADGWYAYGNPDVMEAGLDSEVRHSGTSSAFIRKGGILSQSFRADQYRGQRL